MTAVKLAPHPVEVQPPQLDMWARAATGVPYVHELRSSVNGPDVLITAIVHGNEYAGAIALADLLSAKLPLRRGRVTGVFCNVAALRRFDPDKPDRSRFVAEDLNRVWRNDRLDGQERNIELDRARELLPFVDRATHLLDLHSMHEPCSPLLVTGTLPRNIAFGQSLTADATIIIDEGHADGVRLRDYGGFGDPDGDRIALLFEAGQHWARESVTASRDMIARFLVATGSIQANDVPGSWRKPSASPRLPVQVTHRVVARSSAFVFVDEFTGLETIEQAGTVIANDGGDLVTTPYDDCVLVMPSLRQLCPGVTTVRLGRRTAATHAAAA